MKVRYRREGNRSYLIIGASGEEDYQIRMIQENRIDGLLSMDMRRLNGDEEYYYDITGRQSLQNLFGKRQMSYEDIRGVLFSAYSLTEEVRRYLVEVKRVLFEPEFCFYNPDTGMAEWVFYENRVLQEFEFEDLAEFILEHADHDDKRGVDIGYKFYKMTREVNFSIEQIIEYIDEKYPVKGYTEEEKEYVEEVPFMVSDLPVISDGMSEEKPVNGNIWEAALGRCKELIEDKLLIGRKKEKLSVSQGTNEKGSFFVSPAAFEEVCTQTELIIPQKKQERRCLRRLGKNEVLEIPEKYPCIIGKDKKGADIVIDSNAVSRVHARIYEQGGMLMLQDLNSKNGTFKNGIQLEINESVLLQSGDEVCFANLQYIYE